VNQFLLRELNLSMISAVAQQLPSATNLTHSQEIRVSSTLVWPMWSPCSPNCLLDNTLQRGDFQIFDNRR